MPTVAGLVGSSMWEGRARRKAVMRHKRRGAKVKSVRVRMGFHLSKKKHSLVTSIQH